jgi:hypothetical protein
MRLPKAQTLDFYPDERKWMIHRFVQQKQKENEEIEKAKNKNKPKGR